MVEEILSQPVIGYIYRITCKPNGKVYVGMTTKGVARRYRGHLQSLRIGRHSSKEMQVDFDTYGARNFKCELLEEVTSGILLDYEAVWMVKSGSLDPGRGYNTVGIVQIEEMAACPHRRKLLERISHDDLSPLVPTTKHRLHARVVRSCDMSRQH